MRTLVGVLILVLLRPATSFAQNTDMFNGLDAWELARGVPFQTTCEVRRVYETAGEYYCFSSQEAFERFSRDVSGNIDRAQARFSDLARHARQQVAESADPPPAPLTLQPRALYTNSFPYGLGALHVVNAGSGRATRVGSMRRTGVTDIAYRGTALHGITFSAFLRVNPTTGASTVMRVVGVGSDLNALAYHAPSGQFYAAAVSGRFSAIDTTGRGRLVGAYGGGIGSSGDLAFSAGGGLYATVKRTGFFGDFLAVINRTTGRAAIRGPIGFNDVWGLSFRSGVLYGVTAYGQLLRINPSNGRGTLIGTNGLNHGGMTTSP